MNAWEDIKGSCHRYLPGGGLTIWFIIILTKSFIGNIFLSRTDVLVLLENFEFNIIFFPMNFEKKKKICSHFKSDPQLIVRILLTGASAV